VTCLSPLLFWAPDVHLQSLEKIWVDRLVHIGPWIQFIDKLNTEWQEFSIIVRLLHSAYWSRQLIITEGHRPS
jgi:hypothetical protein